MVPEVHRAFFWIKSGKNPAQNYYADPDGDVDGDEMLDVWVEKFSEQQAARAKDAYKAEKTSLE